MDLALELSFQTVEDLCRTMSEREFVQWGRYARRFMLPSQRFELQLANLARMSAGTDIEVAEFLIDPRLRKRFTPRSVATAEEAAHALASLFGGANVVRLGRRKVIPRVANG